LNNISVFGTTTVLAINPKTAVCDALITSSYVLPSPSIGTRILRHLTTLSNPENVKRRRQITEWASEGAGRMNE